MALPLSTPRRFFRDPVAYVRAHGGERHVLRFRSGPSSFTLVRDPEAIWRLLVTDSELFRPGKWKRRARRFVGPTLNTLDGEVHRRRRLLLQPSLSRRRIAAFGPPIAMRVERVQEGWRDGDRIELRGEFERLALTVAGDVLLSHDLAAIAPKLARAVSELVTSVPRFTPPVRGTRAARVLARVHGEVDGVISERRRSSSNADDLLGRLLASGLPDEVVRGEVIACLHAAVDEPASALEAAWYLLGLSPDAEERFHAELDGVLDGRVPTLDVVERMPYLDAVLLESLRLFPPARHIDRCPVGDLTIAGSRIPAGSNVLVSPLVTHHEPRLYDSPSEFLPERWLEPARRQHARGAYLPFGAGAHTCIGESLARAFMTLALATIGRRWRLRVDANARPPGPRSRRLVVALELR